jgi:hypothetical protein
MSLARGASQWARTARDLYLVAMAVFVVTIAIGILNGTNAVEFGHDAVLTHVHSGTVGWLTLTIVASAFLLFRAADRRLMLALGVLVPVYVVAFYTGNFAFRAISGTALLLVIGWLLVWVWRTYLAGDRSLPGLALALGITSFGYGAVLGVLLQIQAAMGQAILGGDAIGAHAGAMTFGYLVLCAMGLLEWRVLGTKGLPRAGVAQMVLLFIGGVVISVGLLAGAAQAAGGIYLLTQLIAVVLFVVRVWPRSLRVAWAAPTPDRHLGLASIWIVVALVLFMYIVFSVITAADPSDPNALPGNVLVGSDHGVYLGVITNIVIALLSALVLRGPGSAPLAHAIFWGVNVGLVVFVVGLVAESELLKQIGAPVMGLALYGALGVLAWRALSVDVEPEVLEPAPAAA